MLVDGFNKAIKKVPASSLNVGDDPILDIDFFTTNLPCYTFFKIMELWRQIVRLQHVMLLCIDLLGDTYTKGRDE